jgi:hypothetical protein
MKSITVDDDEVVGGTGEMVVVQNFASVDAGVLFLHAFHRQGDVADFERLPLVLRLRNAFRLRHSQSSFLQIAARSKSRIICYIVTHLSRQVVGGGPVHDESHLRLHAHRAVEGELFGTVFQVILLIVCGHGYVRGRRLSRRS